MIVLFTDFGTRDAYVAQLKGVILRLYPQAHMIDLTHDVTVFDIREAAYLLDAAVRFFPGGTICVAVVDPGVGTTRRPLLLHTQENKYYLGPDNGLFTRVIAREQLQTAYVLTQTAYFLPQVSTTFHGRDIFAPVAAHLAQGMPPATFGPPIDDILRLPSPEPRHAGNTLWGEVMHIDRFGNVVTNISSHLLPNLSAGQQVTCTLGVAAHILPVVTTYGTAPAGQLVCLINSNAEFEVALACDNAALRLGLRVGDRVGVQRLETPAGR